MRLDSKTSKKHDSDMDEDLDIETLLEDAYRKKEEVVASNGDKTNGRSSKDKDDEHSRKKDSKKKKDRSRSRSRSKDRKRDRKRSRSKDRKRSRDRKRSGSRSKKRSRTRSRSRDARRHRDKKRSKTKEKSPDLTPEERDQRTVFCMQLAQRIRPRDLEEFFSSVGTVRDVRLITDPRTKRSKGIAYVEFKEVEAVSLAIGLTGQRLLGVPILVKPTQAEKNRVPNPIGSSVSSSIPQGGPMKLYVGSLHVNITEDMLRSIFEPFGRIDAINLVKDEFGRSKGYGFVQFTNAEDAKRAMEQLNGFELAGRAIKISHVTEKASDIGGLSNLDSDELDRTGLNLGTSGKLALMAKLAEGSGLKLPQYTLDALNMATAAAAVASQTIFTQEAATNAAANGWSTISTQCLMISNMFDIEEERDRPNWQEELVEDVIEECTNYGGILHCRIDEISKTGNVYIKAPTIAIAMAINGALHGRYFGGRVLQATFIPVTNYHQLFPESIHAQTVLPSRR